MFLRIVSILSIVFGNLSIFVVMIAAKNDEQFYSMVATAIGLVMLGVSGLAMNIRQYRGGAASILGAICLFLGVINGALCIESYIRFGEYQSSAIAATGMFLLLAVVLLLQGYRYHSMALAIKSSIN